MINAMRGLLLEDGVALPVGIKAFRQAVVETLEAEQAQLTPLSEEAFRKLYEELEKFDTAIVTLLGSAPLIRAVWRAGKRGA